MNAPLKLAVQRAARTCDIALMLYHAGRIRQGRSAEMLTQDNLEAPYQCRLDPLGQAHLPH